MIRAYKSAVTIESRRLGFGFTWQSRFYDRIIRNDFEYEYISNDISQNPSNRTNVNHGFYKHVGEEMH